MFTELHDLIKRTVSRHHKWMMLHRRPEWEQLPRGLAKPAGDFAVCECGIEVRVPYGTTHCDAWGRHFAAAISVTVNDFIQAERVFLAFEEKLLAQFDHTPERTGGNIVVASPCIQRPSSGSISLLDGVAQGRAVRALGRHESLALRGTVQTSTKALPTGVTDLRRLDSSSPYEVVSLAPEVILNARTSFTSLLEEAHGVALEELELIGGGR